MSVSFSASIYVCFFRLSPFGVIPFSFASCFSWLKSRAIRGNEKARSRAVILGAVGWGAGIAGAGAGVAGTSVGVGSVAVGVGQGMISSCERDGRFRFRLNDYAANGSPFSQSHSRAMTAAWY